MIGEEALCFVCVLEEEGYRQGLLDGKRVFLKKERGEIDATNIVVVGK